MIDESYYNKPTERKQQPHIDVYQCITDLAPVLYHENMIFYHICKQRRLRRRAENGSV